MGRGAVILVMAGAVAVAGAGEDVPVRWGGAFSPNQVAEARGLPEEISERTLRRELRLGTHQYSIPTVDRGRVYLGVNDHGVRREGYRPSGGGAVLCVDAATFEVVWQLPIPRNMEGVRPPYYFDQWRCGVCSGPVVAGERVYVVGNRGDVLCLDRKGQADGNDGPFTDELAYMGIAGEGAALAPTDGDIIWRYDMVEGLDVSPHDTVASTLLLAHGLLYAATSNGQGANHLPAPRPDAPTLAVLDARTGRLVAKDDERIGRRVFHGNWSSPCYGEAGGMRLVFLGGGDGMLYAFHAPEPDPEGRVQTLRKAWQADCNPPHFRRREGRELAYSSWNRRLADGPSEPIGTPVFHEGRVYVAVGQSPLHGLGDGCLTCFDAATGAVVWRTEKVNRTLSTVALHEGVIYLPDCAGDLHAFDAATGETLWRHALGGPVQYANALVADGKVYAGTERGEFWVFRAGREKAALFSTRLPSPPITAAAGEGVLYIPMQNRLNAYGVPGR